MNRILRALTLLSLVTAQPVMAQALPTNQDLHAALHLRPDQEAAWQAYDAATSPTAEEQKQDREVAERLHALPTPARLDLMIKQMDAGRAALVWQATAIKRLYERLSPEQRRTFDDVTLPPAGGQ